MKELIKSLKENNILNDKTKLIEKNNILKIVIFCKEKNLDTTFIIFKKHHDNKSYSLSLHSFLNEEIKKNARETLISEIEKTEVFTDIFSDFNTIFFNNIKALKNYIKNKNINKLLKLHLLNGFEYCDLNI